MNRLYHILFGPALICLLASCGGGDKGGGGGAAAVSLVDITGGAKSNTGNQTEMAGWVLGLMEKDTGVFRVATINSTGGFTLAGAKAGVPYGLIMMAPDYVFSSVTSISGTTNKNIRQYFSLPTTVMPTIVHNGPIVKFASESGLTIDTARAADANGNGIPDGMDSSSTSLALSTTDTDGDGILNGTDVDIDGDGIANRFDDDDDGDGTLDAFDSDANGDGTADTTQSNTDIHFTEGVEFINVTYAQEPQTDGSTKRSLTFTAKLQVGFVVESVKVRSQASLFTNATYEVKNASTGAITSTPWSLDLADDGSNEDGASGDGLYARRVILASGTTPKVNQVMFIQLHTKVGEKTIVREYPYKMANLTTGAITLSFDTSSRTVTRAGTPFTGIDNFLWSVHVYNSDTVKVFSSEAIAGDKTTYVLPTTVLESGKAYSAIVVAQSLERIPSYPAYIVKTASTTIQEATQ